MADPIDYLNPVQGIVAGFRMGTQARDSKLAEERLGLAREAEQFNQFVEKEGLSLQKQRLEQDKVLRDIQQQELSEAIEEKNAIREDFPGFQKFQVDVADYLDNPDRPFPKPPVLNSRTLTSEASKLMSGVDQYSNRARMMRLADEKNAIKRQNDHMLASEGNKLYAETGIDYVTYNDDGSVVIDQDLRDQAIAKKIELDQRAAQPLDERKARAAADIALRTGTLTPDGVEEYVADKMKKDIATPILNRLSQKATAFEAANQVVDRIDKFNKQYGRDEFDSYVGPFDARVKAGVRSVFKPGSAKEKEAAAILQDYQALKNGTLRTLSGQAVTASEAARFDKQIGTPNNPNFVEALRNFRDTEQRELETEVESFRSTGYRIPSGLGGTVTEVQATPNKIRVISIKEK